MLNSQCIVLTDCIKQHDKKKDPTYVSIWEEKELGGDWESLITVMSSLVKKIENTPYFIEFILINMLAANVKKKNSCTCCIKEM